MISVIIPALNEERLLPAMLAQFTKDLIARHDLEVVVSDGGSSDATLALARSASAVVVENGLGVKQTIAMGRNIGAAHARGDLFVFLNADTLMQDPESFFSTVTAVLREPGVAAVTCAVAVYPGEERRIDRWFHGFYNWFFAMMNVVGMGMGRGECHIMTRDTFRRVGGYNDRIVAGEDYDMFRRLKSIGRIRFLHDIVVYESPRRYRRYGYLYISASWFMNFLSVFFLKRSLLSEWKPVR